MSEASKRWRAPLAMMAGVSVAIAAMVLAFGGREPAPVRAIASARSVEAAAATSSSERAPASAFVAPSTTAPPTLARAPASRPPAFTRWPSPPVLGDVRDPSEGDPFESKARRPHDVRELVRVGDVRLGVTYDSKVRDEHAVVEVLRELGEELDAKERGRTDSFERRAIDYQPMLLKYGARLAPLMDGAFAFKGGSGWSEMLPAVAEGAALPEGYRGDP